MFNLYTHDYCPSYLSKQPTMYVLEVNLFCTVNKVNVGDRLQISPIKKKVVEPTTSAWQKRVFLAAVSF
jgi:hypothetical protein